MSAPLLLRRHPLLPRGHRTFVRMVSVLAWILAFVGLAAGVRAEPDAAAFVAWSQESQPPPPPAPQTQPPEKTPPRKNSHSHQHDFLLIGTVFTEKGFSLEGAELRVRRTSEKKFRWETLTDRRGEFAVRVQQGADYEIVVRAKGFQEQTRTVDAKSGDRDDLIFRLKPVAEGKSK